MSFPIQSELLHVIAITGLAAAGVLEAVGQQARARPGPDGGRRGRPRRLRRGQGRRARCPLPRQDRRAAHRLAHVIVVVVVVVVVAVVTGA